MGQICFCISKSLKYSKLTCPIGLAFSLQSTKKSISHPSTGGRGGNAARGVVVQMLRPERVLIIFCLKAEDSEGFDSTVAQTLYQSLDWNIFGDNLSFIGG